jgi:hypothetical protein
MCCAGGVDCRYAFADGMDELITSSSSTHFSTKPDERVHYANLSPFRQSKEEQSKKKAKKSKRTGAH